MRGRFVGSSDDVILLINEVKLFHAFILAKRPLHPEAFCCTAAYPANVVRPGSTLHRTERRRVDSLQPTQYQVRLRRHSRLLSRSHLSY
jgi:hypothetical protein